MIEYEVMADEVHLLVSPAGGAPLEVVRRSVECQARAA